MDPNLADIARAANDIRRLRSAAVFVGVMVGLHIIVELARALWEPAALAQPAANQSPPAAPVVATASGNTVTVQSGAPILPNTPRTVEQVADYLSVTPDTVREAYIPAWIAAGHMTPADKVRNQWIIPEDFTPYRP